jgi:sterol-4alpha-carboxylate 3-dehydrogenase (decarboxylating)
MIGYFSAHVKKQSMPDSKLNILVTGGAGFLGSFIVKELLDPECPLNVGRVRVFDLKSPPAFHDRRVEYFRGDVCNADQISQACEGIDLVIHSAAIIDWGTKTPKEVYATNFGGTKNVVAACRLHQVSMLVYTSSLDVVITGKPLRNIDESQPYAVRHLNMYCESKCLAEQLVLSESNNGLRTCALRPADIWGEGDPYHIPPLIEMAKSGFYTRIGNGKARNQHVYAGNVAWAHVLAAKALIEENSRVYGNAYFVTDGEPANFFTFFDEIVSRSGYKIWPRNLWLPKGFTYVLGIVSEYIALLIRPWKYYNPKLSRFAVMYTTTDFTFSAEKAKRDFGFRPRYGSDEALKRTVAFFRKEELD